MNQSLETKLLRENQRLKNQIKELKKVSSELVKEGAAQDHFLESLREVVVADGGFKFSPSKTRLHRAADDNHEEIACVALSDLHLTETVRPEDSNGINKFNSKICASRLWHYSQKVKSIIQLHSKMYKIKGMWSPLLGDIVNGSIHPELVISNDLSDPAACLLATRLLGMFYKEIGSLGLPIEIDAIHGNHPRLTAKMPTKRQAHTNLDWLIYESLKDLLKSDQVRMTIHTGQIGVKSLYKWRYLFEHGMDVSSGHEEAYEDRIRALFDDPTFRKATGLKGAAFDQIVIGNMHKPKFLERTIVNGSFTGQNELGVSWRLKPIKSQQLMWGVSAKKVRTWMYQVDLTDIRSERPDNPFTEYTCWFMKKHGR